MKKSSRSLIIIRHAHRDTRNKALDNGLSPKGRAQVTGLVALGRKRLAEAAVSELEFFSSPKKRCLETLKPIADLTNQRLKLDALLLEQQQKETMSAYRARVKRWISRWGKSRKKITLISSHGDWIPIAVKFLTGARITAKKGSWIEIRSAGGPASAPQIYSVIQDARRNY